MLKNYRPLLLQDISLSAAGITVRQLRLNQLATEPVMTRHAHDWGQLLVYLDGRGRQQVGEKFYDCRPGSVIFVNPQAQHLYEKMASRPALVLVMDVDLDQSRATIHTLSQMPDADLVRVKAALSRLFVVKMLEHRESSFVVGSVILEVLDRVLRASGWLRPVNRFADSRNLGVTRFVERLLERADGPDVTLEQIASRAGYEMTAINRKLKGECGMTLGQLRSRIRLRRAQELIAQGYPINTVAERVHIPDNNYFTRWFRQQTGATPTRWKKEPRMVEKF